MIRTFPYQKKRSAILSFTRGNDSWSRKKLVQRKMRGHHERAIRREKKRIVFQTESCNFHTLGIHTDVQCTSNSSQPSHFISVSYASHGLSATSLPLSFFFVFCIYCMIFFFRSRPILCSSFKKEWNRILGQRLPFHCHNKK